MIGPLLAFLSLSAVSAYNRLTYSEIEAKVEGLRTSCSSLVNITTAQAAYHVPEPSDCNHCKHWVIEFTRAPAGSPHVFFSGALHGDERLGPVTTIALAEFLCENFPVNPWVRHLVSSTRLILMPMPNPQGYYLKNRGEKVHGEEEDPNRDFGYFVQPNQCMKTTAARAIYEVLSHRLVVLSITFHGGTRAVGYPWGAPNHMENGLSSEAPDKVAAHSIGNAAISYSNLTTRLGPMTDTVYEVAGGMEDWAYAASWETGNVVTKCNTSDYTIHEYNSYSFRQLMYLVEMDNNKNPEDQRLGSEDQVFFTGDELVPTYLRFSLAAITMAKPYVEAYYVPKADSTEVFWRVRGCEEVDETYLLVSPYSADLWARLHSRNYLLHEDLSTFERVGTPQQGKCGLDQPSTFRYQLSLSAPSIFLVAAHVDRKWTQQAHPDPAVPPQSHVVKMRNQEYFVQGGDYSLVSNSTLYSPVLLFNSTTPATRLSATLVDANFDVQGELHLEGHSGLVYLQLTLKSGVRANVELSEFGDLRGPEFRTWGPALPISRLACQGVPDLGYFSSPYEVTFSACGASPVPHFIGRTALITTERGVLFGVLESKGRNSDVFGDEGVCVIAGPGGPVATLLLGATGKDATELFGFLPQAGNYTARLEGQEVMMVLSSDSITQPSQPVRLAKALGSLFGRRLSLHFGSEELGSCVVGLMNPKHTDPIFSHPSSGHRQLQSAIIIGGGSGLSLLAVLLVCYCGRKHTYHQLSDLSAGTNP